MESCANIDGGLKFTTEAIVEDFQLNPRMSVLFLSLDFHIKKPLYIKQRFEEVYRATRRTPDASRVLLLLSDCGDEMNYLSDLQMQCMQYET